MKIQYLNTTEESLREDEYHRSLEARYDNDDIDCIEETMRTETTDLLSGLDESKIVRGKEFKNYKEMCIELNIGYKGGDTKRKQLKELEVYYFLYKQDGRKFKITKVHNLTDIEKRVRTLKSNYKDYIEELIIDTMIKNEPPDEWVVNYFQLARAIGVINKNYTDCMANETIYSNISNYRIEIINDWKVNFQTFLRGAIKGSIQNLEDKDLITCEEVYLIFKYNKNTQDNRRNNKTFLETRLATLEEEQIILKIKKECLSVFQAVDEGQVFRLCGANGFRKYINLVRSEVAKEIGIQNYSLSYRLKLSDSIVGECGNEHIDRLRLTRTKRYEYISQICRMVIQRVNSNSTIRHKRATEVKKNKRTAKEVMRASKNYIETCKGIANDVISRNTRKNYSKNIQEKKLEIHNSKKKRGDFIDYLYNTIVFNKTDSIIETVDRIGGIYAIHNLRSDKRYVGSTRNFSQRLKEHKRLLEKGAHHSYKLQDSFDAYYESDFRLEILEVVDESVSDDTLLELEQRYMDALNVFSCGYNIVQASSNK